MEKKITFLELLQMLKNGSAPKKVCFDRLKWVLNENMYDYFHEGKSLSEYIGSTVYMYEMADFKGIVYEETVLTIKENAYLSAVLKPFKNRVKEIIKYKIDRRSYIHINFDDGETLLLPYFTEEIYKDMKEDKSYTPSELGLWEEEGNG